MFGRLLSYLDPLHGAEVVAQRYFFTTGASKSLWVSLVRLKGNPGIAFALPREDKNEGGNLIGHPILLSPEKIDEMIAFLQDCRAQIDRMGR